MKWQRPKNPYIDIASNPLFDAFEEGVDATLKVLGVIVSTKREEIREGIKSNKQFIRGYRSLQKLYIDIKSHEFILTREDESVAKMPLQTIPINMEEAEGLCKFISKHLQELEYKPSKPSKDTGYSSSPRLSRTFPEHYPHHGNYPPGKPPERGD